LDTQATGFTHTLLSANAKNARRLKAMSNEPTARKLVPVEPTEAQIEPAAKAMMFSFNEVAKGELTSWEECSDADRNIASIGARAAIAAYVTTAPSPPALTDAELREILATEMGAHVKYGRSPTGEAIRRGELTRDQRYALAAMREVERRLMEGK
jgi:hypothetical protein